MAPDDAAPVWRRVDGNPWRRTRLGAVVAAPGGVAVLEGPAGVLLGHLPATAAELAAVVGDDVGAAGVETLLHDLAANGLVEPARS